MDLLACESGSGWQGLLVGVGAGSGGYVVGAEGDVADPEVQEALSGKFGGGLLMLLPLESGNWAIFNSGRKLLQIFDPTQLSNLDLIALVAELSEAGRGVYQREVEAEASRRLGVVDAGKNLDEMGL